MNRKGLCTESLAALEAKCREQGLPLTTQRRIVLEALAAREDHPTADEILEQVRERLPEVSRTTVYRVLATLVQLGLAVKISSPGAAVRFDAKTRRHHHLVCVQCERVMDFEAPRLSRLPIPNTAKAFDIFDYSIHFRGRCATCRSRTAAGDGIDRRTRSARKANRENQSSRRTR